MSYSSPNSHMLCVVIILHVKNSLKLNPAISILAINVTAMTYIAEGDPCNWFEWHFVQKCTFLMCAIMKLVIMAVKCSSFTNSVTHSQTQWEPRHSCAFILFIDTLPQKSLCRTLFLLNNFKKHCSLKNYKMLHTKCTWNNNTRFRKHHLNLYFYFTNHPTYPNLRNDIHFKVSKIELWCLCCQKWEHIVQSLVYRREQK